MLPGIQGVSSAVVASGGVTTMVAGTQPSSVSGTDRKLNRLLAAAPGARVMG